jgi:aldose 1-epimerase
MAVTRKLFGTLGTGEDVYLFILEAGEFTATLTNYGAILISVLLPDGRGGKDDILLGFSTLAGYAAQHPYFGATVGRYANRIAGARFSLDGKEYRLAINNGPNHLHGGLKGFDKHIWNAETYEDPGHPSVRFSRVSPDGEEGYPGTLGIQAHYSLSEDGSLSIEFSVSADARSVLNLTNHAYFNLRGEGSGPILDHELELACSRYLPVDANLIPTGELASVDGGSFDFRNRKAIGKEIAETGGYDHCFVIDHDGSKLVRFASVLEPKTGRCMTADTSLPGVQFYTGNFLSGVRGKRGSIYDKHAGFCLETQLFPDTPNQPSFPSCIIEPGAEWKAKTVYRFSP